MRAKGQKAHGKKKVKYKTIDWGEEEGTNHCYYGNTKVERGGSPGPLPPTPKILFHSQPT